MLFSRDWLAEYVELEPEQELAARLTASGSSVEHVKEENGDVVFDVDITGNRADCMNHRGLAREIAVLRGVALELPRPTVPESGATAESLAGLEVVEPGLCPRYSARVIEDVTIGPSPEWLRRRLEAIGVRAINNVVDVTNFVLWEMGQPLHAFDLDRLASATVVVRLATAGESLQTLDGVMRDLLPTDLVIADARRPVALAGIMGGLSSEVTPKTRRVLLESAHFDRSAVRRTAKRLGLHTDASHRFERGTDSEGTVAALDRAAALLADLASGSVRRGVLDQADASCFVRREIAFSPQRLEAFAGAEFDRGDLGRWFRGLGLEVEDERADRWKVRVPSWRRFDLERAEDLYEEALRIRGFASIPAALPPVLGSDGPETPDQRRRRMIRHHLVGQGFAETVQYSFVSVEEDARYPVPRKDGAPVTSGPVELANPLSDRYSVLRRSMVPALVDTARFNQRRGAGAVRLFEVGNVFLAEEVESLGIVLGGTAGSPWDRADQADLFELKGVVDSLLQAFAVEVSVRRADLPAVLAGTGAELRSPDGEWLGWFGRLDDDQSSFPLFAAELFCRALGDGAAVPRAVIPSSFPGVAADLTLTHSVEVSWAEIERAISDAALEDLQEFGLKDRYQGEGVPAGAVNTTVSFRYNAPDRSLRQEEVNARQAEVAKLLDQRFGWSSTKEIA